MKYNVVATMDIRLTNDIFLQFCRRGDDFPKHQNGFIRNRKDHNIAMHTIEKEWVAICLDLLPEKKTDNILIPKIG